MTATWNEPLAETWNGEAWVPCTYELRIMEVKPSEYKRLQIGRIYGGNSWREVFKNAREDMAKYGKPTARIDPMGRLIINDNPATKPN